MAIWSPRSRRSSSPVLPDQILALKYDAAPFDVAIGAQEVDDRPGHGALAAAGLADDAVGFAAMDLERDILDRFDLAAAHLVGDGDVFQFEHW